MTKKDDALKLVIEWFDIAQLQLENQKLREFIAKSFEAHSNLDLDIEALGETK